MNIFYASAPSANNLILPDSKIWDYNLKYTLQKMGFSIFEPKYSVHKQYYETYPSICPNLDELNKVKLKYSQMFLNDVKEAHEKYNIDLLFTYFSTRHIIPEIIDKIKELGITTVNFYCNNVHQFDLVSEIAPHYDYCMFPEREALKKYKDIGANPVHVQMAANPDIYKPYPLERKYDVTFVGQNYLNRKEYIKYLYNNGIDTHIWGPGWEKAIENMGIGDRIKFMFGIKPSVLTRRNIGKPLLDEELIKMYSMSKISLNFSEVLVSDKNYEPGTIKRHIRLRDFEAPMSGAFYLTGYQDELKEYYRIGKEIVCYDSKEDLLEKIRYYLQNPEEAEKIRTAGYQRAIKDHTWENRFRELFNKIGVKYGEADSLYK